MMLLAEVPQWAETVSWIAGTLVAMTGGGAALWKIIKFVRSFAAGVRQFAATFERFVDVIPQLIAVGQELQNNGGKSLKDRIEQQLNELQKQTSLLEKQGKREVTAENKLPENQP